MCVRVCVCACVCVCVSVLLKMCIRVLHSYNVYYHCQKRFEDFLGKSPVIGSGWNYKFSDPIVLPSPSFFLSFFFSFFLCVFFFTFFCRLCLLRHSFFYLIQSSSKYIKKTINTKNRKTETIKQLTIQ